MDHSELVQRIRCLTVILEPGRHDGKGLLGLFQLRLDQVDLSQPVIGVDRQVAFRVLADKIVEFANGPVIVLVLNQGLDLVVGGPFFR